MTCGTVADHSTSTNCEMQARASMHVGVTYAARRRMRRVCVDHRSRVLSAKESMEWRVPSLTGRHVHQTS